MGQTKLQLVVVHLADYWLIPQYMLSLTSKIQKIIG